MIATNKLNNAQSQTVTHKEKGKNGVWTFDNLLLNVTRFLLLKISVTNDKVMDSSGRAGQVPTPSPPSSVQPSVSAKGVSVSVSTIILHALVNI